MDVELARRIVAQKALARKNQTRRNRIRLVGLLLGIAPAILWFLLAPDSAPEAGLKLLIGLVGGQMLAEIVMARRAAALFPERARCPECGHDWEIREGSHVPLNEVMPNWDNCPGCGLLMSDLALFLILKRGESGESPAGRT